MPVLYMLTGIDRHWPAYIRHATTSHWSVRFKPSRWQHLNILGTLAKELSMLVDAGRCLSMPVDAFQCLSMPVNASQCRSMPVNAGQCRSMPVNAGQCRSMPVSIYKTGIYLMLVSWIQTIKVTTSQHPWDLGQGVVQGRFQGICSCYFLGSFLGTFLGHRPKDLEMLSGWWFGLNWPV